MALTEMSIDQVIEKMNAAIEKLDDYVCLTDGFSSKGEKEGWRTTEYKFLKKPEMVYGKVVKNKSNYKSRSMPGSRYLLRDGKIEARLTGLLSLIPFKARADDRLAMWHRGERLDQSHLAFMAKQFAKDHASGMASAAGTDTFEGKDMYVFEVKGLDPKKNFGIDSYKIWVDNENFFTLKIEKYERGKAVSSWSIKQLKVNTGLKKADFSI